MSESSPRPRVTARRPQPADRVPSVSGLMARAARLHFEFGLTHQDTAAALGISRVKVTRVLKQARQAGIVKITVVADVSPFAELEDRLAKAAGLREAIIVPVAAHGDRDGTRSMLARGAVCYLERVMRDGIVVAVGANRAESVCESVKRGLVNTLVQLGGNMYPVTRTRLHAKTSAFPAPNWRGNCGTQY